MSANGWDAPPPLPEDDPGPGEDDFAYTDEPEPAAPTRVLITDPTVARWLGLQAAKANAVAIGREMVDPARADDYAEGTRLPAATRLPHGLSDATRKAYMRELERAGRGVVAPSELPVSIVRLVQRHDVGVATKYDMTLRAKGRDVELCDLSATDMLNFEKIRPVAFDARLVLPPLSRAQAGMWLDEMDRAMGSVVEKEMSPEESEAMEIRQLLMEMAVASRPWEWSDDDPTPGGLAVIQYGALIGWPRGPMKNEVRNRIGKVSRVAARRAVKSLGWVAKEWHIETAHLRVWTCAAEVWIETLRTTR